MRNFKEILLITLGIISAAIGLKGFLLPNSFIDGGAMGISLLTNQLSGINLSLLIVVINIPFLLIGFSQNSNIFLIKSIISIVLLSILVHFISIPVITQDRVLISVFGGGFLGIGIGLTIRGGAVIDGSENLAIVFSRKFRTTVGDFITIFNLLLFSISAIFLGIETAMYSVLIYFSASKTADFIITGIEEYIGITIISPKHDEIRLALQEKMGRATTVYLSKSKFAENNYRRDILFCVVTRIEVNKTLNEIEAIDSEAFIIQQPIKDVKGGLIKKRPV